jgi:hypothetical protein
MEAGALGFLYAQSIALRPGHQDSTYIGTYKLKRGFTQRWRGTSKYSAGMRSVEGIESTSGSPLPESRSSLEMLAGSRSYIASLRL